jgi:hypothetical protein
MTSGPRRAAIVILVLCTITLYGPWGACCCANMTDARMEGTGDPCDKTDHHSANSCHQITDVTCLCSQCTGALKAVTSSDFKGFILQQGAQPLVVDEITRDVGFTRVGYLFAGRVLAAQSHPISVLLQTCSFLS